MIKRWVVLDPETREDAGSIFACSRDCAEAAAEVNDVLLGSCQGRDGVDVGNDCDGGCER